MARVMTTQPQLLTDPGGWSIVVTCATFCPIRSPVPCCVLSSGYEMLLQGVKISHTEFMFYGKGRDTEFLAASLFFKKLAQGAVMQLASRQMCDLYVTRLMVLEKVALFYGTINHFINIWIQDVSIFAFTYMMVLYQVCPSPTEGQPQQPVD